MDTLAAVSARPHIRLSITTEHPTQFIDLTDQVEAFVADAGLRFGIVNIQSLHTTTAIVVNEHEPLLLSDFTSLLHRAAPRAYFYRHDDLDTRTVNLTADERANGHAHCRALLLGTTASMNVADGRLQRGCWQRIFLVELDGPRAREVSLLAIGDRG
jgi:secondary thiamine-phosphate synthase enzyme